MKRRSWTKGNRGFTVVELMIAMAVTVFVLAAASQILIGLITQFKQQGKIAETSIESLVGLEILRRDVRSAGYGIPWNIGSLDYTEAASVPPATNDDGPDVAPRAVLSVDGITGFPPVADGTDYLVIKSTAVAPNAAAGKSHILDDDDDPNTWVPDTAGRDNLEATDHVIVLEWSNTDEMTLLEDGSGNYYPTFSTFDGSSDGYTPVQFRTNFIYGIDSGSTPLFPFNRADYYLSTDPNLIPMRCATGTGVFVKSVMLHTAPPTMDTPIPLLDCVADVQVVFQRDTNDDEQPDLPDSDLIASGLSAADIREEVRAVEIYILAHEGQRDPTYTYPNPTVSVGGANGNTFDLTAITDYDQYRWRVYTLVEKPEELTW